MFSNKNNNKKSTDLANRNDNDRINGIGNHCIILRIDAVNVSGHRNRCGNSQNSRNRPLKPQTQNNVGVQQGRQTPPKCGLQGQVGPNGGV